MRNFYFIFLLLITLSSCHKEETVSSNRNYRLEFSRDSILFDTIFSTVGSVTQRLKVFNPNKEAVIVSSIELGGKASSPYQTIINGQQSWYLNNQTIRGGDSLYVLVSIKNNQSLPYLVNDSIVFSTNGNLQKVQLLAYGQDAVFINGQTIPCNEIWTSKKPYVIYNNATVALGCTLTINKGAKVYFHDKASLKVDGTLIVKGSKDSVVTFSGDKLTNDYKDLPGQWAGIQFSSTSHNNSIDWGEIKNAITGILLSNDPTDNDTIAEVTLSNTIIKNMSGAGVESQGRDVMATNCLMTNCVRQAFAGFGGGSYYLQFCTLGNYSYHFFREQPTMEFSNMAYTSSGNYSGLLTTRLTNCIVWGDLLNELSLVDDKVHGFDFSSSNCILKTTRTDQNINGNLVNVDPLFTRPVFSDFHLETGSPAIDAGTPTSYTQDLDGKSRDTNPDIGAFEK